MIMAVAIQAGRHDTRKSFDILDWKALRLDDLCKGYKKEAAQRWNAAFCSSGVQGLGGAGFRDLVMIMALGF